MTQNPEKERDALVARWQREGGAMWPRLLPHLREGVRAWLAGPGGEDAISDGAHSAGNGTAAAPLLAWFDELKLEREWRLSPPYASFFELLIDILTRLLEEAELRRLYFKRDEEQKIDVYTHPVNLVEGLVLEVIKLREFLVALEEKMGRKARVIFQAKYLLGYSYQEIADHLEVGTGSVRYQLQEATNFFISKRGSFF